MEKEPVLRYKKMQKVFESLLSDGLRLSPITVDLFVETIVKEGAIHAFESAFHNSTTTQIGLERLRQIENIPYLLIWGENDDLIPPDNAKEFKEVFKKKDVVLSAVFVFEFVFVLLAEASLLASKTVLDPHPTTTAGAGIIGVGVFLRYSICLP
jgi:hypothetical protein